MNSVIIITGLPAGAKKQSLSVLQVRRGKAAAFEGKGTREEVHSCDRPPSLSPSQGDNMACRHQSQ